MSKTHWNVGLPMPACGDKRAGHRVPFRQFMHTEQESRCKRCQTHFAAAYGRPAVHQLCMSRKTKRVADWLGALERTGVTLCREDGQPMTGPDYCRAYAASVAMIEDNPPAGAPERAA